MFFKRKTAPQQSAIGSKATPAHHSYGDVLDLSNKTSENQSTDSYWTGLKTELRISRAIFDPKKCELEVNGWCLSSEASFDLLVAISGTNIVAEVRPNTEDRLDVFDQYPQYGKKKSGWRVKIPVSDLPEGASARAVYAGQLSNVQFERSIIQDTPPTTEEFHVKKCTYSPLRSLCQIEAFIVSERDDFSFEVTPIDGKANWDIHSSVMAPNSKGQKLVKLSFTTPAMRDKEELIIRETGHPSHAVRTTVTATNDSPRRITATTPSVRKDHEPVEGALELDNLIALKQVLTGQNKPAKIDSEICFFPEFDDPRELSNHYHRASWYLTGEGSPISKVTLASTDPNAKIAAAPDYFANHGLNDDTLEIISSEDGYLQALMRAKTVLVWKPLSVGLQRYLSRILDKATIITVATQDPASVEYGNYCRSPWMLLPEEQKTALLKDSQARFRAALQAQRDAGKTSSAVFGTGPSIDTAFDFDFSDCMTVACNSIVANEALLDHIKPAFVCAGDAVSHFGVSRYAQTFRADLVRVLQERGIYLFTSAAIGFLLVQKHPEIRDHVILCEQKLTGLNADLENIWSLPRFDSTLNIHMLPIAATFSDTIYMLGLDGRDPNPENNEDFWAHSKAAQYHDLVDSGHLAHPTFAINRAEATEDRYLASVEESFMAGEVIGKSFFSLAHSFTPAVHARPAPARCFGPVGENGRRKLLALSSKPSAELGKKALVVMRVNRRHFSGGRYHGTWLAEAMAAFCDKVVVWTNNMPPWAGDLRISPDHGKIEYWIDDFLQAPEGHFDYVVILPDGSSNPVMYHEAFAKAQACNAKTAFINFESPNWFNALSPAPKKLADADTWFAAACFSDIILSSAQTAIPFAERFYKTLYHKPTFAAAPPAINSPIADLVKSENLPREKQITLISRFGNISAHKNINAIFDCITPEMKGYTLALIAGTSDLPDEATLLKFRSRLEEHGMALKLLYMISDRRKYEEIAKSELMIFPSLFEGFGYPPVEAGYMNTPCVAYDLPVLQEFNADHAHFVPWGDTEALRAKVSELLRLPPESRLRCMEPEVQKTASLADFSRTLEQVFNDSPEAQAATSFTNDRFALARKVYLDGCHESSFAHGPLSTNELHNLANRYIEFSRIAREALEKLEARCGCGDQ
mgnify:CR=1 FL=1